MADDKEPKCIECGGRAKLVDGQRIYPHRPDLYSRNFYLCQCGAYCGTHKGTTAPLGYPCGPETRRARSAAHAEFDPLWKGKAIFKSRSAAYRWLAKELGIPKGKCHIGMMTKEQAVSVINASKEKAQERDG